LIPTAGHTDEHIQKTLNAFEAIKPIVFEQAKEKLSA